MTPNSPVNPSNAPATLSAGAEEILGRLDKLRELDAPTHGGRVLSYVYDSGLAELDELAARAARAVQPVNGLDPTTFPSVAALERDVVTFAREVLRGDDDVVGSVTSGGTESCLLAVKTARDLALADRAAVSERVEPAEQTEGAGQSGTTGGAPAAAGSPGGRSDGSDAPLRIVAPSSVHSAFHKAAQYFGLEIDLVPVDPGTGAVAAADLIAALDVEGVALVVVSAPGYPHGVLDPVTEVAAAAAARGIACHVDACFGGWVLPWWSAPLPDWDFTVPGVTSISADLHKYGYAPKGVSVLLHRGRRRHRGQFFAIKAWPGYPVVNPTMLGSRPAAPLAAAWAIIQHLGTDGFAELTARSERATKALTRIIGDIQGLRVVGEPAGPVLAIAADDDLPVALRVDPHHWADRVRTRGWVLQQQPGFTQGDGTRIPHTTHLTITPVTESVLENGLAEALRAAADEARGLPAVDGKVLAGALFADLDGTGGEGAEAAGGAGATSSGSELPMPGPEAFPAILSKLGIGRASDEETGMPEQMAPLMALIETLPAPLVEGLLTELLASLVDPRD